MAIYLPWAGSPRNGDGKKVMDLGRRYDSRSSLRLNMIKMRAYTSVVRSGDISPFGKNLKWNIELKDREYFSIFAYEDKDKRGTLYIEMKK